jgi:hypothetical protein
MITDIPTPDDFKMVGLSLLNQAWDTAMSLLLELKDADAVRQLSVSYKQQAPRIAIQANS